MFLRVQFLSHILLILCIIIHSVYYFPIGFILDFDNGPWGNGSNYGSRSGNMGMRGGIDMKGGNYRGSGDSWGGNSGVHSIHMRGLPFKATEQDIADVIDLFSSCVLQKKLLIDRYLTAIFVDIIPVL